MKDTIKLTQYSHGAGCGCKIAPDVLDSILKSNIAMPDNERLIVGNHTKDDAAVYDLGNGTALISTTDFFMPIVDDPYDFGRIASANAISDVYAMGGRPVLAIAILGWPVDKISTDVAAKVLEGSRSICAKAGIPLAGGHSIDAPEPIFGLAVNGLVSIHNIRKNNTARPGDLILLTKPLGVGILTTAQKKGILEDHDSSLAPDIMMQLNKVGEALSDLEGVHAMTDVTGFGLLGHLTEMCQGSGLSAELEFSEIPLISPRVLHYLSMGAVPGGTQRNLRSLGTGISYAAGVDSQMASRILADPQTSGGLLIAVDPQSLPDVKNILQNYGNEKYKIIGSFTSPKDSTVYITP